MRFLLLLLALSVPSAALAQKGPAPVEEEEEREHALWGWVDGAGWHFVDSLELVPAAHRATATKMRVDKPASAANRNTPPTTRAAGVDGPPPKTTEPEEAEEEKPPASRAERIAALEARLVGLLEEIAAMEEGNVPQSYLDAAGGEDKLTNETLGRLMGQTEDELIRVETELERLRAAR